METMLWYCQLDMTQKCVGIIWFYYGNVSIESEDLKGFDLGGVTEELKRAHRDIGKAILGDPMPLGP